MISNSEYIESESQPSFPLSPLHLYTLLYEVMIAPHMYLVPLIPLPLASLIRRMPRPYRPPPNKAP